MQTYIDYFKNLLQNFSIENVKKVHPFWKSKYFISSVVLGVAGIVCLRKLIQGEVRTSKAKKSVDDLNGKTMIITYANTGIGLATAITHSKMGANVIFGTDNDRNGEKVMKYIQKKSGNKNVQYFILDMNDLSSVELFANNINNNNSNKNIDIDFLVLNPNPYTYSQNNSNTIDYNFSSNTNTNTNTSTGADNNSDNALQTQKTYLSNYYLAQLLLNRIKFTADKRWTANANALGINVRIICVANKVLEILHMKQLQHELFIDGYDQMIACTAMHPGFVRHTYFSSLAWYQTPLYFAALPLLFFVGRDIYAGSQTIAHLACNKYIKGGAFYINCKESRNLFGYDISGRQRSDQGLSVVEYEYDSNTDYIFLENVWNRTKDTIYALKKQQNYY